MPLIFFFESPSYNSTSDRILVGARDVASKLRWNIRDFDIDTAQLKPLVDFWKPSGVIIECGDRRKPVNLDALGSIPIVYIDHDPTSLGKRGFNVLQDSVQTGEVAARELMLTDYRHFAFVPFAGKWWWNDDRKRGFTEALALNGFDCHCFTSRYGDPNSRLYLNDLRAFLAELPKPCALFAANDRAAEFVLFEAKTLNMRIPEDLAILGVDDYLPICEHTTPKLSSIRPDLYRGGELAVLMLAAIIRDGKRFHGPHMRRYSAECISRRASTRVMKIYPDKETLAALELIRSEACNGLKAETVLQSYSCSRGPATRKFRAATGHSIQEEIHAIQLEKVQTLLVDRGLQLKSISDFCGFTNPNSLRKFFLRETGMTMSAWRNRHM